MFRLVWLVPLYLFFYLSSSYASLWRLVPLSPTTSFSHQLTTTTAAEDPYLTCDFCDYVKSTHKSKKDPYADLGSQDDFGRSAPSKCGFSDDEYKQTECDNCGINPVWFKKPIATFRRPVDIASCRIMDRDSLTKDDQMGIFRLTSRYWDFLVYKHTDGDVENPCRICNNGIDNAEKMYYPIEVRYNHDNTERYSTSDFWKKGHRQGYVCLRAVFM